MSEINIGSTIIGKSGKKLIVDRVEGDTIYSGDLKILLSAVVEVIPPPESKSRPLVLGDRVRYIGTDPSFKKQYGGTLTIWELDSTMVVGDDSPDSPASPPKTDLGNFSKLKVGDRVRYIGSLEKSQGIEGVVVAEFGVSVDVKWDSGVNFGLVKTRELEVI